MTAILLDARQSSVVFQAGDAVQVCDPTGAPLGLIVPLRAAHRRPQEQWIECWNEWYCEADEAEAPRDA